jgi:hypothetical protein
MIKQVNEPSTPLAVDKPEVQPVDLIRFSKQPE